MKISALYSFTILFFVTAMHPENAFADKICIKARIVGANVKLDRTTVTKGKCPKGYTEIVDTLTLAGPQGAQGSQGPQGSPGPSLFVYSFRKQFDSAVSAVTAGLSGEIVEGTGDSLLEQYSTPVSSSCSQLYAYIRLDNSPGLGGEFQIDLRIRAYDGTASSLFYGTVVPLCTFGPSTAFCTTPATVKIGEGDFVNLEIKRPHGTGTFSNVSGMIKCVAG